MPRERIPTDSSDPFALQVSWSRDTATVELGTVTADPAERVPAILAEGGLRLVDATTGDPAGTAQIAAATSPLCGWFVHLSDRRKVNTLISLLRRARGQAFGEDA